MGQVVSIPGSGPLDRRNWPVREPAGSETLSTARVIPGSSRPSAAEAHRLPRLTGAARTEGALRPGFGARAMAAFAPASLLRVSPSQLGAFLMDITVVCATLAMVWRFFGSVLSTKALALYACAFLAIALQENLYAGGADKPSSQVLIGKACAWAWLVTVLLAGHSVRDMAATGLQTLFSFFFLSAWRRILKPVKGPDSSSCRNALVVGPSLAAHRVAEAIRSDRPTLRCVKAVVPERQVRWAQAGAGATLGRLAREQHIDEVILAGGGPHLLASVLAACDGNGLDLLVAPEIAGLSGAIAVEHVGGMPLVKLRSQISPEWTLAIKRLLDALVGASAMIISLPLMAAIAALIKMDSPGPVLYVSERIGRKGQPFTCYKFRTMRPEAEKIKTQLRMTNDRHGAFFKMHADPRITRLGHWLRRYSLDELPQLWNVLRGNMSLVGPRPHPPDDVERYALEDLRRLDFTPGMTGLWQVVARNDPSFERCVALDIEYIRRWNLLLDFRILGRTVAAVLRGSGV